MWQHGVMPKRSRDPNQLAKLIVDIATGEVEDTVSPMKLRTAVAVLLSCMVANAQSVQPRQLTVQEAHAVLEVYLPDGTKRLPGYELEDFAGYDPARFYFVEVVWDNPGGSVVWGNYAVDKTTGDLWSAVICEKYSSKRTRAVQHEIRRIIGLTDEAYNHVKRPGPMCE